jgi:hypothetical protein
MCTLRLPLGFLDRVDGSSIEVFFRGKEIEKKGKCLVKWEKVCSLRRQVAWVCGT